MSCAPHAGGLSRETMEAATHLDGLNPAQRAAATFGVPEGGPAAPGPPLLVIAGCRHRQDRHAGASRRPPGARRCRSAPGPAADLHPPGGRGHGPACRADLRPGAGDRRRFARRLEWAGTFHAIGARLLRHYADRDRPRPGLHHPRPRRRRRPDRPRARRAGPAPAPTAASRRRPPASRSTPTPSTPRQPLDGCCATPSRGAPSGTASSSGCSRAYVAAKQRQGVLDYDDLLLWWERMLRTCRRSRPMWAAASTSCWSTSTRTPTRSRPRSCSG